MSLFDHLRVTTDLAQDSSVPCPMTLASANESGPALKKSRSKLDDSGAIMIQAVEGQVGCETLSSVPPPGDTSLLNCIKSTPSSGGSCVQELSTSPDTGDMPNVYTSKVTTTPAATRSGRVGLGIASTPGGVLAMMDMASPAPQSTVGLPSSDGGMAAGNAMVLPLTTPGGPDTPKSGLPGASGNASAAAAAAAAAAASQYFHSSSAQSAAADAVLVLMEQPALMAAKTAPTAAAVTCTASVSPDSTSPNTTNDLGAEAKAPSSSAPAHHQHHHRASGGAACVPAFINTQGLGPAESVPSTPSPEEDVLRSVGLCLTEMRSNPPGSAGRSHHNQNSPHSTHPGAHHNLISMQQAAAAAAAAPAALSPQQQQQQQLLAVAHAAAAAAAGGSSSVPAMAAALLAGAGRNSGDVATTVTTGGGGGGGLDSGNAGTGMDEEGDEEGAEGDELLNGDTYHYKGPWTAEEDTLVLELVKQSGPRRWAKIAQHLPGRIGKQCRERWHNHLNPAVRKDPWTAEEELVLFNLHRGLGNAWSKIAKMLPGRSDNSIKNHWNSNLLRRLRKVASRRKCEIGDLDATALDEMKEVKAGPRGRGSRTNGSSSTVGGGQGGGRGGSKAAVAAAAAAAAAAGGLNATVPQLLTATSGLMSIAAPVGVGAFHLATSPSTSSVGASLALPFGNTTAANSNILLQQLLAQQQAQAGAAAGVTFANVAAGVAAGAGAGNSTQQTLLQHHHQQLQLQQQQLQLQAQQHAQQLKTQQLHAAAGGLAFPSLAGAGVGLIAAPGPGGRPIPPPVSVFTQPCAGLSSAGQKRKREVCDLAAQSPAGSHQGMDLISAMLDYSSAAAGGQGTVAGSTAGTASKLASLQPAAQTIVGVGGGGGVQQSFPSQAAAGLLSVAAGTSGAGVGNFSGGAAGAAAAVAAASGVAAAPVAADLSSFVPPPVLRVITKGAQTDADAPTAGTGDTATAMAVDDAAPASVKAEGGSSPSAAVAAVQTPSPSAAGPPPFAKPEEMPAWCTKVVQETEARIKAQAQQAVHVAVMQAVQLTEERLRVEKEEAVKAALQQAIM